MPLDENEVTSYTVDGVEYDFTPRELADLDQEGEIMQLEAEADNAEAGLIEALESELKASAELLEAEAEAEAVDSEAEAINAEAEKLNMESSDMEDEFYDLSHEANDLEFDLDGLLAGLDGEGYNDVLHTYIDETNEAETLFEDANVEFDKVEAEYYEACDDYYYDAA